MALSGERSPCLERLADLLEGGLEIPAAELLPQLEGVEPLEPGLDDSLEEEFPLFWAATPFNFFVGVEMESLSILVVRDLLFVTGALLVVDFIPVVVVVVPLDEEVVQPLLLPVPPDVLVHEVLEQGEIRAGSCGDVEAWLSRSPTECRGILIMSPLPSCVLTLQYKTYQS